MRSLPSTWRQCLLALAAGVLCLALPVSAGQLQWRELSPGLEFLRLPAASAIRVGNEYLGILRVDPRRFAFKVLAAPQGQDGFTAGQWREKTGALAVVNAGQYASDQSYLGLLVTKGAPRGRLASRLEALFLAGPVDEDLPAARVLDLRYSAYDPKSGPYEEAAQSLMLVDRFGHIRVRRSPQLAHRTAVGQDEAGRILLIISEGGCTLWELADFLKKSPLGLRGVMSMDGGAESQLDVAVGDFEYEQYGSPSGSPDVPIPWPAPALPAALAVMKKK